MGCAGRHPSRAIFLTVTGLIFRKTAASSGVTNGSLASTGFTVSLHSPDESKVPIRLPLAALRAGVPLRNHPTPCALFRCST